MTDSFDGLKALDRDLLMSQMAEALPDIQDKIGITVNELAIKVGMEEQKLAMIEEGDKFQWIEFMSILFVLWNNDRGRGIIEDKGLFPDALKKAMATNRNEHIPVTESSKYGI